MDEKQARHSGFQPNPDEIRDIPIGQLLLDAENPRLALRSNGDSQEGLVKVLWTEMAVDELAWSIAKNGFFRSEPLFVIMKSPDEKDPDKQRYIAIEGNRRLAAVLLLRDERLRQRVGANRLPDITADQLRGLDTLPAIVYQDRKSLWTTVGFRHINGIKSWDSFSKAKYVADVYENFQVPLSDIAEAIGDRHETIRLYRGYKILQQAESQAGFDREDIARNRLFFSHLYTAVDQKAFQDFLGIDSKESLRRNPVPEFKLTELSELMTWLYGRKSSGLEPKVMKQVPDLNTLREVIGKLASLSALRSGYSLERSYAIAVGDKRRFRDALTSAKVELQNAKATVTTGYAGEPDLYDMLLDIVKYSLSLRDDMDDKRQEAVPDETKREGHLAKRRRGGE